MKPNKGKTDEHAASTYSPNAAPNPLQHQQLLPRQLWMQRAQAHALAALQRLGRRLIAVAFASWFDSTLRTRRQRVVCGRALCRLRVRALALALEEWCDISREQMLVRVRTSRIVLKRQAHCVVQAWEAWEQWAEEWRMLRRQSGQMLLRTSSKCFGLCFRAWEERVRVVCEVRERSLGILLGIDHGCLARAFAALVPLFSCLSPSLSQLYIVGLFCLHHRSLLPLSGSLLPLCTHAISCE